MPAMIMKENELRKYFEDSGLDYDAASSRIPYPRRATAPKVKTFKPISIFPWALNVMGALLVYLLGSKTGNQLYKKHVFLLLDR